VVQFLLVPRQGGNTRRAIFCFQKTERPRETVGLGALAHKYGDVFAALFVLATTTTSCHSERSEESPSVPPSVAEDEILRFTQDDKIGGLTQKLVTVRICRRNYDSMYLVEWACQQGESMSRDELDATKKGDLDIPESHLDTVERRVRERMACLQERPDRLGKAKFAGLETLRIQVIIRSS